MKRGKFCLIMAIMTLLCLGGLHAYQMSPLTATYATSGVNSANSYTIVNDSDSPIAIEMKVMKRMLNQDGTESTEEASNYFSVQPSKMIIQPQSTQIVRVQYRGPRTVTKEMSFRIIAEQIPYNVGKNVEENSQTINFLFVYSTSAYVSPSREVVDIRATAVPSDDKITITISNEGTVHKILTNLSVELAAPMGSYKLTEEELEGFKGVNLLTDSSIVFEIDMPEILKGTSFVDVSLSY